MRVFICKSHDGVWLSGCSVVLAESEKEARELLDAELQDNNLDPESEYKL